MSCFKEKTVGSSGVSDLPMDDGLPSTVTVLDAPDGGKVYLVGTAHFSIQSQEDVSRVCVFSCIRIERITLEFTAISSVMHMLCTEKSKNIFMFTIINVRYIIKSKIM